MQTKIATDAYILHVVTKIELPDIFSITWSLKPFDKKALKVTPVSHSGNLIGTSILGQYLRSPDYILGPWTIFSHTGLDSWLKECGDISAISS